MVMSFPKCVEIYFPVFQTSDCKLFIAVTSNIFLSNYFNGVKKFVHQEISS